LRAVAVLDVADTHRDQRGADAEAEREGASGVIAGRTAARGRAARFGALRGRRTEPGAVFASTEIREMISENLDELSPLLRTAFVLREVQGYSTAKRRRNSASRKIR